MFPPFPQEKAKIECQKLMAELDNGLFRSILHNAPGEMFGVAVCRNKTGEEVVLRSFSGQLAGNTRWLLDGFVPPLIDVAKWNEEVERADPEIKKITEKIETETDTEKIVSLKKIRRNLSNQSLKNIYELYSFYCWDGKIRTYHDLIPQNADIFSIPTGTGDCCAPKLINFAYKNGLQILSMAEFFYGNEPNSALKKHKTFYPPCEEKCKIILPVMLGLNILYRDFDIIVINKPCGLLSAPGKGSDKFDCVPYRVRRLIPDCIEQPCVHRLDMDTSGILVLGLNKQSHRALSIQFQDRLVEKKYVALLRGNLEKGESGTVKFPMRVDLENRPYQIYDEEHGRMAETKWRLVKKYKVNTTNEADDGWRSLVEFTPLTGRTHQLRLHSAHDEGLGIPIVGDRLYGKCFSGERLCLQEFYLEFTHPVTNKRMRFEVPKEF